jgi:hypothetical protein
MLASEKVVDIFSIYYIGDILCPHGVVYEVVSFLGYVAA